MTTCKSPLNIASLLPHRARVSVAALSLLALGWSAAAHAYPVAFPSRGDALENGAYFRASGHTKEDYGNNTWGIDFHAAAFINSVWSRYEGGISGASATNDDAFIFDAPIYAPEDGEIIACWRSAPNKPDPNTDYDFDGDGIDGEKPDDVSPVSGGNHLQLRNADGDYIIYFAHLETNTIPTSICPLPAGRDADSDGWPDNNSKPACSLGGTWDGMITGTLLPTPVPVKKGDFLGRAGHSGASDGPHLHMHVKPYATGAGLPCEGPSEEIEFVETWSQACPDPTNVAPEDWDPLLADNPLQPWVMVGSQWDEGETFCFLPDGIGPQQDHNDYAVAADNLHFTSHSSGDVLVYQSGGALRLRSYKVETDGTITDQSTVNEGSVLDVAVARPRSDRHVVVSIRGSNGDLKHIPYTVSSTTGAIARQTGKELTESAINQVESTPSPAHNGYVVAIEDSAGNLKVIDYDVDSSMNITRKTTTASGGAIDDVAITTVTTAFDGVVTAELNTSGTLILRSFAVPAAGGVTWADTYTTFLSADSVTIDRVPVSAGLAEIVVTSVQLSSGTLRLDTWELDASGQISWIATASAGTVSAHDAAPTVAGGDLLSVMRDDDDNFRMIGWQIDPSGQIRRNATRGLSAVTDTAIVAPLGGGQNHLVAARTDALGKLHLFSYGSAFTPAY